MHLKAYDDIDVALMRCIRSVVPEVCRPIQAASRKPAAQLPATSHPPSTGRPKTMKNAVNWKRKVFFFIDRLQIPVSERRVLPLLLLSSLTAWTAALVVRHPRLIDPEAYAEEQRRFEEVYKASFDRHAEIMARYALEDAVEQAGSNPAIQPSSTATMDTVRPRSPSASKTPSHPRATPPTQGMTAPKVDLNSAGIDELVTLPGVGPAIAQRILDWREQHGRFTSVDQLREVRGIGEATLGRLRPFVLLKDDEPPDPSR
jgi:competence ComEA-like helix-hairpin-helix protein